MQLAEILTPSPANTVGATGSVFVPFLLHLWGWVPGAIAVIGGSLGIVWYTIMIWESETVKTWRHKRASRYKLRKIARLEAKAKVVRAQLEAIELKRAAAQQAADLVRSAELAAAEKVATASADAKVDQVSRATTQAVDEIKHG